MVRQDQMAALNDNALSHLDEYELRHLTAHLEESGQVQLLHRLLTLETNEQRNAWHEAKEATADIAGYTADVARAWRLAEEAYAPSDSSDAGHSIALQCRYALITASISSLASNTPPTLMWALVEKGLWSGASALAYAYRIPDPYVRVEALKGLTSYLSEPRRTEALLEALAAARQVLHEDDHTKALVGLAPHLPEAERAQALQEALAVAREAHESGRGEALARLIPYLPEPLLGESLTAAQAMWDERKRDSALAILAPKMAEVGHPDEALAATRGIRYARDRCVALAALLPHLPEAHLQQGLQDALDAVWKVHPSALPEVLAELAPHLPEPQLSDALAIARASPYAGLALAVLAPHLSGHLLREALTIALSIEDADGRTSALVALIPHLPDGAQAEALPEALAAISETGYRTDRANALAALAPHLSDPLLGEALTIARGIVDPADLARALVGLAPHLPEQLLCDALTAALSIKDAGGRAKALAMLIPDLPETERAQALREALAAVQRIRWANQRAEALAALAPHLAEADRLQALREALANARRFWNAYDRAKALAMLAPHLPEQLAHEALTTAYAIRDSDERASALARLAPHLPDAERAEALREALAAALEVCPGKPLVNSVTGEDSSLTAVLPLVKERGCAVIGLCIDEQGIPKGAGRRLEIARKIVRATEERGIPREDLLIDPLAMTVGADHTAGLLTMEAITAIAQELKLNIVYGGSNVSFGLPERSLLNRAYLAMAMAAGLTCVIADPLDAEMRRTIAACDLLWGRDEFAVRFIQHCRAGW